MIDATTARLVEVGPRDGFQNIQTFIPTDVKVDIIDRMFRAGVGEMEITSFVSPKAVPQMADAAEVTARVRGRHGDRRLIALVPNLRGAAAAAECGLDAVTLVISASERHNLENVRKTPAQSLADLEQLRRDLPGLKVRLDIATSFGCPFLGEIAPDAVMDLARKGADLGASEVVLCDTIGAADPNQVERLAARAVRELAVPVGLHLHDTRGLGLANALAGLHAGVRMFETSIAGLGGCPFAPGASGNTATEDLLNMLSRLGVDTGVDMERYLEAVTEAVSRIPTAAGGHMAKARPFPFRDR